LESWNYIYKVKKPLSTKIVAVKWRLFFPPEVTVEDIQKGNKKTVNGWVMYDWANSVYQLTIASAIFPVYYNSVTRNDEGSVVSFFGSEVINTVIYSWAIAAAYFLVAILSPIFSSIADYSGRRKAFMKMFTILGALSCSMLFFFNGDNLEWGIIFFALGTFGYAGSLVFYNSFLPVIARPADHDRISARGYSMGYLGGVILLVMNLVFVLFPEWFGITDDKLPAKLAFLSVGLWWYGFSQITFRRLPKYTFGHGVGKNLLFNGYKELRKVFVSINRTFAMKVYLPGFFFITMGILTVMFMAASYGEKQLGLKEDVLIPIILCIQLVGMLGAWMFARISGKIGNFKALIVTVIMWILVIFSVYFVTDAIGFAVVAFWVGLVMGGSQSLLRSTYSKMIPKTEDHTSFFSFYDVMEKLAIVGGTFSFGVIEAITGSMKNSVFAIVIFFFIGLGFLLVLLRRTPDVLKPR
jgi:UMF1 family MFS transporter